MRGRRTVRVAAAALALLGATTAGCAAPTIGETGQQDQAADAEPGEAAGDDDDTDGSDDGGTGDGGGDDGGAVAAPDPDGERAALGAPVRIPREVQDQGRPLDEVWSELEEGLREQCDGEVCVELVLEESHDSFSTCQFVETRPRQQTEVERGSTVVVVAGSTPCEDGTDEAGTGDAGPSDAGTTEEADAGGSDSP